MSNEVKILRYNVQFELTIETEQNMEKLTRTMFGVIKWMEDPYRPDLDRPKFTSVEIEQIEVKRLARGG